MLPTSASAQVSTLGYIVVAPVVAANFGLGDDKIAWHVAGGLEVVRNSKWGIGGEVGAISYPSVRRTTATGGSFMPDYRSVLLSGNASYHFVPVRDIDRALHPFVSGGFSFVSGTEGIPSFNVGGGADWWVSRHAGLRLDIR